MQNTKKRTDKRKRQRVRKLLLFLFVLLVYSITAGTWKNPAATVQTIQEIRVGLKSKYAGKNSICIGNEILELGYCDGREYCVETVLSSAEGIEITPEKSDCFSVKGVFLLEQAEQLAAKFEEEGVKAYGVLLSSGKASVYLTIKENGTEESKARTTCEAAAKKLQQQLESEVKKSTYLIRIDGGDRVLFADGSSGDYPQFSAKEKDDDGIFSVELSEGSYRGRIEVGRYGGRTTLTAVNVVPIEEYLYGVVPYEMPASWPMEALKAQAVCARSYALLKAGYHPETDIKRGYRMVDTVQSQVYGGTTHEHARSNAAVDATKGQTLCYENRTVAGYFFSTSGGHTENVEDVWGSPKEYLQGVPDLYEQNPSKEPWSISLSESRLAELLRTEGKDVGSIEKVVPEITTASGRIYRLKVIGSKGNVSLTTDSLRNVLDLPGTKFKLIQSGTMPDTVTVQGKTGTKQAAIHDCYIISGDGNIQIAEGLTDQYVVLSADNMTNFPKNAPKEGEYLFAGMGHGHGVGMSQSGARGMAEQGFAYTEILEHYFTGISVR